MARALSDSTSLPDSVTSVLDRTPRRAPTAAEKSGVASAPSDSTSLLDRVARRPQSDRTSATTAARKERPDTAPSRPPTRPTKRPRQRHEAASIRPHTGPRKRSRQRHEAASIRPHTGPRKRPRQRHGTALSDPPHGSTKTTTAASRSDLDRTHHTGLGRAPDGRPESSKTQAGHLCGQTLIPTSRVGLDSTNTPAQDVVKTMSRHRRRPRQATPRPDVPTRRPVPSRPHRCALKRRRDTSGTRHRMALKATVRPAPRTAVTDTPQPSRAGQRATPKSTAGAARKTTLTAAGADLITAPPSARAGPHHGRPNGADSSRARARGEHECGRDVARALCDKPPAEHLNLGSSGCVTGSEWLVTSPRRTSLPRGARSSVRTIDKLLVSGHFGR